MNNTIINEWIKNNQNELTKLSDEIWAHPEQALHEHFSSSQIASLLQSNGFQIEWNLGGMETAFKASWGSGHPVIAYLGEYDALAGLSQKPLPYQEPIIVDGAGHGCGHNLLGVGLAGAAIALKNSIKNMKLKGTVVYFGCPAEETMTGKILMAASGCFNDIDVALSWHPMSTNQVIEQPMQSMYTVKFTFYGKASHAAVAPENGRSALDAIELMNVGVNYLREHVSSDVRIHYSITDGGGEPNLIHSCAQSWYYIRAAERSTVKSVFERICNIARGSALMTETHGEASLITGCYDTLEVETLNELLYSCLTQVSPPLWSEEEKQFAEKISMCNGALSDTVLPLKKDGSRIFGSSDVADVSHITPTGQIGVCTAPIGTALHTWQFCSCAGTSIGHKAILYATEVLANAGYRLVTDESLLKSIKTNFYKNCNGHVYEPFKQEIIKF